MDKFTTVTSVAAPLPQADIDTDMILPAQFLLRLDRALGPFAFHASRHGPVPFVLDQPAYKGAQILVAGPRFGIGSSREHAVWALHDLGVRCIVAPSFGEIFQANAVRNGILPISLDADGHARVLAAAEAGTTIRVDLDACMLTIDGEQPLPFPVAEHDRETLREGLDETAQILAHHGAAIEAFEARQARETPWIDLTPAQLASFQSLNNRTA
ncbi:3-isopropylmalate dehydratase small subunit [Polymorphobacter sp.]|uniref:3-isopropylmalate dehydratase small subunit n=1 Tax=Polymorphobacter sp. TaxID=1909290 RepID=UPI003F707C92